MTTRDSTTIQISTVNRDLLDELALQMMEKHPGIWQSKPPYNAVVGFALESSVRASALESRLERIERLMFEQ